MPDESRIPVLVGMGQLRANRERTVDGAREPLELMARALELAERDAGVPGLLRSADSLAAIRTASWTYDDLAGSVAARIGANPRGCENTPLGGQLPARLLDRAAAAIWAGESDVAVVVGGEAQASANALAKAGVDPVARGWSATPGGPPPLDLGELGSAEMLAAGLFLPPRTYPLFENRLQADLGLTAEENAAWSARLYADLSRVAAGHPVAWSPDVLTPEQVGTVGPGNRMVCEPYPLSMNAMPNVDQAVAVVVTSLGTARDHGVPGSGLTYVWGGAGVDDPPDPLRRTGFSRSRALGQALDRSLDAAGLAIGDVDLVDVYSCFPVVPKLAALHLGLDRDAVLSVAGGHSSFGGPLNTYSLHAIATMAERLRAGAGSGLVHANGGYLSYQHSVLLGSRPHPEGYVGRPEPTTVAHADAPGLLDAATAARDGCELAVETATVEHGRDGAPEQAFVVGRTPTGERVAAATAPACDVPSHLYSLSFAPKADWSRRFAPQAEIHHYLRDVARDFGVLRHIRFGTEVLAADFDEDGGVWRLTLAGGAEHEADVLVSATGQLSRPSTPAIVGLDRFEGTRFHSAQWDHDHDLTGERVAVLGTGASAIQFVPAIAPRTASLTVFQRSAPHVLAKPDRAYRDRAKQAFARVPGLLRLSREGNYFSNELRSLGFNTEPRLLFAHKARYRRHLREAVADPALREKLTPTDPMGCKRILMSNDWYPALQLPQVDLVTERIAEVRPHSIVTADGTEREVDTIVLGTGFAATEFLAPMRITGRGGRDLHDQWKDGASAYLGTVVPGFPNLFVLYGPNTNLGHNSIIVMLEAQVGWVVQGIRAIAEGRARRLEVRRDVAEAFDAWVQERVGHTVFAGGCRSWYLTESGRNTQNWPASTLTFRRRLRRLRLEEFEPAPVAVPGEARA